MAKNSGQKLKLLYIVKILTEESDEKHPISTKGLIDKLAGCGVAAERKSIYDDIAKLQDFGYDIIQVDNRNGGGYYMASREFELAELKFLVDAVQSCRFITQKKSRELIQKLEGLAGKHDAGQLQRQVFVAGRVKTGNESIYYSIDALHKAMQENKRISFLYMEWNGKKELVPRRDGQRYRVSPWTLVWKDENYYLVAYDEEADMLKHYRVDKLAGVELLESSRAGREKFDKLDLAEYANTTFGMYGGTIQDVVLTFPESLCGVVIDRFGRETAMRGTKEGMRARIKVVVSPQFFGWLAAVGRRMKIASPDSVAKEYRNWLRSLLEDEIK